MKHHPTTVKYAVDAGSFDLDVAIERSIRPSMLPKLDKLLGYFAAGVEVAGVPTDGRWIWPTYAAALARRGVLSIDDDFAADVEPWDGSGFSIDDERKRELEAELEELQVPIEGDSVLQLTHRCPFTGLWFELGDIDFELADAARYREAYGVHWAAEHAFAEQGGMTLDEAVALADACMTRSLNRGDLHLSREAKTFWYVRLFDIGCRGFIVDKKTGRVEVMGSCHSLEDCFWAYTNGVSFDESDLHVSSLDDSVADEFWRALEEEPRPVPCVLERIPTWFPISTLRELSEAGKLAFRATPSDS